MTSAAAGTPRSIVIAGGGPVGLTIAALLGSARRSRDLDIHLLEPREAPSWAPDRTDLRVYALSRASQNILGSSGVWGSILAARAAPYRRMRVWQGPHDARLGSLTFDSADVGEPDLGHIVEDNLLRARLVEALGPSDVQLQFGVELASVRTLPGAVEVTTGQGDTLSAHVLIAADGGDSAVRTLSDLPITAISYRQRALVTHVTTELPHADTAWQRFLSSGPLAFLPLDDGRSSVVWSTGAEHAAALCGLSDARFQRELQIASGGVLGELGTDVERASFPLQAAHAPRYCRARVVLVGDAAHSVHPLAGQGMNLGLLDAAVLTEVLLDALDRGEDPGDLRVLRRYERRRKGDNLGMMLALDALHRLFRVSGTLMPPLRAAGMSAIDATPLAKTALMRRAMGLGGGLPAAARPPGA